MDSAKFSRVHGTRPHTLALVGLTLAACAAKLAAPSAPAPPAAAPPAPAPAPATPSQEARLGALLCALKAEVRWKTAVWTPATCNLVARSVLASAARHQLSPALILGVMLNESDLDEKVVTRYHRRGVVYATDSGLMGIRCVFDRRGLCSNGHVRGMQPRAIADIATNIELGARELAYGRDKGGVERKRVRTVLPDGRPAVVTRLLRCKHATHAYWAHYNHGSFYFTRGFARHYPHRVGVLYYAFAQSLDLPADEVTSRPLTIRDPGQRPRTADRPVEPRFRILTTKIYRAAGRAADQLAVAPTAAAALPPI